MAADLEVANDLVLEIETAWLMLREEALTVEYEPEHRLSGRSPDFAVTYTTSVRFMVEATRLRTSGAMEPDRVRERLSETICDKLGQLKPNCANVIIVGIAAENLPHAQPQATLRTLQLRAERNDADVIQRHGCKDRAEFFARYRRLSAVMLRAAPVRGAAGCEYCENPLSAHPLPSRVRTALIRSHTL